MDAASRPELTRVPHHVGRAFGPDPGPLREIFLGACAASVAAMPRNLLDFAACTRSRPRASRRRPDRKHRKPWSRSDSPERARNAGRSITWWSRTAAAAAADGSSNASASSIRLPPRTRSGYASMPRASSIGRPAVLDRARRSRGCSARSDEASSRIDEARTGRQAEFSDTRASTPASASRGASAHYERGVCPRDASARVPARPR